MARFALILALAVAFSACGSEEPEAPPSISDAAEALQPLPSTPPARVSGATIVDLVAEAPDLTTLRRLLRESGVAEDLSAEGPFTLFAPSDDAFREAGELPTGPDAIRQLLLGHVFSFRATSADMDFEQTVASLGGSDITVRPGSPPSVSSGGTSASVSRSDLDAGNGVVHVIGGVLR